MSEHMPMFTYTRSDAPATPTESAPSLRMWGTARSVPSGIFSMAVGRWASRKMALMLLGLWLWSVAKRDVSDVPGGCRLPRCQRKSFGVIFRLKRRPSSQYWLPMAPASSLHFGSLGIDGRVQRD